MTSRDEWQETLDKLHTAEETIAGLQARNEAVRDHAIALRQECDHLQSQLAAYERALDAWELMVVGYLKRGHPTPFNYDSVRKQSREAREGKQT